MPDQSAATARARMRERLRFLYGAERGDATYDELVRVLDRFPVRPKTRAPGQTFDQSDAILIAYGDTFLPRPPAGGASPAPTDPVGAGLAPLAPVAPATPL